VIGCRLCLWTVSSRVSQLGKIFFLCLCSNGFFYTAHGPRYQVVVRNLISFNFRTLPSFLVAPFTLPWDLGCVCILVVQACAMFLQVLPPQTCFFDDKMTEDKHTQVDGGISDLTLCVAPADHLASVLHFIKIDSSATQAQWLFQRCLRRIVLPPNRTRVEMRGGSTSLCQNARQRQQHHTQHEDPKRARRDMHHYHSVSAYPCTTERTDLKHAIWYNIQEWATLTTRKSLE